MVIHSPIFRFVLALSVSALLGASANASTFNGGTLEFQEYAFGGPLGPPTQFVTPGSVQFSAAFTINASDDQIVYHFLEDGVFTPTVVSYDQDGLLIHNGPLLKSISGIPPFINVTLNSASTITSGFDVTWNANAIAVDFVGLRFHTDDMVVLDVSSTPLPAALPLFATGLGALGLLGWRRMRKQVV